MTKTKRRRTQAERRESTRASLVAAARELFARKGYADVSTQAIVKRAGVTRGALYHHFDDKRALLRAVYEQLEAEIAQRAATTVAPDAGVVAALHAGTDFFLDSCLDREVQQIALRDAPAVLGWDEWREVGARYGLGLIEALLQAGMEGGELRRQPIKPLAHALLGALDEVAMLVARADDPERTRAEAGKTLTGIVDGLRA